MKRIDFDNGKITTNILQAALPMLVAQILSLLYNIVDRIYIARIPNIGTAALGAVGLCFPIIVIITAFSNLFGSGGAPLFSIERGRGDKKRAGMIMNTSFFMLSVCAIVLMCIGFIFARPILILFGASENALVYAYPYIMIYLIGTFPSMIATGMNPFINAQGYATTGMISVVIGAIANIVLDPLFIFMLDSKKAEYKVRLLYKEEIRTCGKDAKNIVSLGTAGFVMQLTNSLVSICCNNVLSATGGDVYVSVMTIISSVRQMIETPIWSISEGSSPVISYNYGAKRPKKVIEAWITMSVLALIYSLIAWSVILFAPKFLIGIFSSDKSLMIDTVPAMKLYFSAFIFMLFQYTGQTMFKSLNKKKQAIFFSILRKVIIVVPMTYMFPYVFHMGSNGVFMAEPVSNVIGGSLCFIVMLLTVFPELKQMNSDLSS